MGYIVSQRTREFGCAWRWALREAICCASSLSVRCASLLSGLALGCSEQLASRGSSELFCTACPHDLLTLASVSILLVAVALLASYLPARRATLIDPTEALRME